MSTLFNMALKLLLWLRQEFEVAFQEVTKNVVLLTNLKQKLNFRIQKTVHANFAKITSIKQVIHRTGYLSFVDASAIYESLFRDRKAELSLFGNNFWQELVSYENQSLQSLDWFLCDACSAGIFPNFWVRSFSLSVRFLQIFGGVGCESAETVRFGREFSGREVG